MRKVLLDSDTVSTILREHRYSLHAELQNHVTEYLSQYRILSFSIMTRFEILRGLKVKQAHSQLAGFELFCNLSTVLPMTDQVIQRASDIYADLHRRGELIGDADILIAATALEHELVLVTNNTKHFGRIKGLEIVNWMAK